MITLDRLWNHHVSVQTINAMWDDIAEDNAPPYIPDLVNEVYVSVTADGNYIGMFRLHQLTSVMWRCHAFILQDARKAHSLASGEALKVWILDNIEDLEMLVTDVPDCFPNVLAFVEAMGFTELGYTPDCYTKNGLVGLRRMGLNREDMKCQQQQQ